MNIKRSFFAVAVAVFGVCGARADFAGTTTWLGGDGEWSDDGKWDYGVPQGGTNFNINAAGTITFSSAAEVTMPGDWVNNGTSPLVFRSEGDTSFGLKWNTAQWQEFCVGRTGHGYVRFDSGTYDFGGSDRTMLCVGWWWYNWTTDGEFSKGRIDVVDACVRNVRGINLGYGCGDGLLVINGSGSISVADWVGVAIGERALGEIVVSNGTLSVANQLYVGGFNDEVDLNGASGTVNIEGGTITAGFVAMAVQTGATGTINLNGGTLTTKRIWTLQNRGTGTIFMNGGTLRKSEAWGEAFIDDGIEVRVGAGGAIFDTNGFDAYVNAALSGSEGDGGLVKKGEGTLTLAKGMGLTGPTKVYAGTLDMANNELDGDIYIAPGASIVNVTYASTANILWYEPQGSVAARPVYSPIADGSASYETYSLDELTVTADTKVLNSLNSLIGSAAAWYDPKDGSTLTKNEDGKVTAMRNKGLSGITMDAVSDAGKTYFSDDALKNLPTVDDAGYLVFNGTEKDGDGNVLGAGFVSAGTINHSPADGYSLVSVFELDAGDGSEVYPIGWTQGVNAWRYLSMEWCFGGIQNYYKVEAYTGLDWQGIETTLTEKSIFGGGVAAGRQYTASLVAGSGVVNATAYAVNNGTYEQTYDVASEGAQLLDFGGPAAIVLGMRSNWHSPSRGRIGETLAFERAISANEAADVRKYLANKWLGASEAITTNATTIAALTLEDNAEVDFDGADVLLGDVAGSGTLKNGNFTINGTITISVGDNGEIEPIVVNGNVTFGANAAVHVVGASKLLRVDVPFLRVEGEGNSISGRIWSVTTDNEKPAYVTKAGTVYKICKGSRGLMVIIR